jgi:hypothetical protein
MNLETGQTVKLVRDPHNAVDPKAVQVHTLKNGPIGFIRRNTAEALAPLLDKGVKPTCKISRRYPPLVRITI